MYSMESKHILIVDDSRDIVEVVALNLKRAGYTVTVAFDGRDALKQIDAKRPDLILLDVMLPGLSGTEVATRVRANPVTANVPITMLTARAEEADQLVGLTVGADDYITKPFSMKVLIARIDAVLRRTSASRAEDGAYTLGPLEIDSISHRARLHGEPLRLTLTEFRILAALLSSSGRVLSRRELMGRAMGPGVTVTERTIDVHLTAIRRKLGDAGRFIQTVRGVGYRAGLDLEGEENIIERASR